jgi:hypothetical protein
MVTARAFRDSQKRDCRMVRYDQARRNFAGIFRHTLAKRARLGKLALFTVNGANTDRMGSCYEDFFD